MPPASVLPSTVTASISLTDLPKKARFQSSGGRETRDHFAVADEPITGGLRINRQTSACANGAVMDARGLFRSFRPYLERLEDRSVFAVITVDAAAGLHAIDPNIYGVAFASTAQLNDLNVTLNRYGGNTSTRYNWQLNLDNKGSDWFFESMPGDNDARRLSAIRSSAIRWTAAPSRC